LSDDDTQRAITADSSAPFVVKLAITMTFKKLLLVAALLAGFSGCSHNQLFSGLDQCYLADWTNHHSYLSCCCDGGSSRQRCANCH
jgi:hypothetical protein